MQPDKPSRLAQLQAVVRLAGLDGWLLYDFRGQNPFAARMLQLDPALLTRRWFLYLPAHGRPTLIHHRIEANTWGQILPDDNLLRLDFASYQQLDGQLRQALQGARRVAMEYSPGGENPYVGTVDAGTLERVRACGVELVSSADLLQQFETWDAADIAAHEQAVAGVIAAKDAAFGWIDARLKAGQPVSELAVQALLVEQIEACGLVFDHPPIVAFGSHASDGHYAPGPQSDRLLEMGQCVLIDLWAGQDDRPMADITWVGFAGEPTAEYLRIWQAVSAGRDLALELLTTRAVEFGWQVDRAVRDLITSHGYGEFFRHRLGHSLGRNSAHGQSVHLDDWETHDTRRLLPGLGVTVEPGVYLGHVGIRSEVNVLMTESGACVTTPIQQEPYRLGIKGESIQK